MDEIHGVRQSTLIELSFFRISSLVSESVQVDLVSETADTNPANLETLQLYSTWDEIHKCWGRENTYLNLFFRLQITSWKTLFLKDLVIITFDFFPPKLFNTTV